MPKPITALPEVSGALRPPATVCQPCGLLKWDKRHVLEHNLPALLASGGDDLQQLKMEVDAIGAHLRGLFLIKFALKSIRWEPMRRILVLQPARGLARVLSIVRTPKMEQIRDHHVLLANPSSFSTSMG